MEGKSCYDLAIDKDDIRMLLDVHLLTTETTTNGNCDESDASTKGMFFNANLKQFVKC